jgi:hypothetical protein
MPSFNHIADWQDEIQFGKEAVTYGTLAATLNVWGAIGPPTVEPGPEFLDSGEGGSGLSERLLTEFAVGKKQAIVEWKSRLTDQRLYHALRSMAQSEPTKAGVAPFSFTWSSVTAVKFPYVAQPSPNLGYSIICSQLDGLANASPQYLGAICESFVIESAEGGFCELTTKWRGTTATLVTAPAATSLMTGQAWSHYHIQLQLAAAAATPSKYKMEFTNNMIPFWGTSQTPTDLVLGRFGVKGSMSLPYKGVGATEYAKFISKTPSVLVVDYATGALAANGNMNATFDITYSGAKLVDTNGLKMVDLDFTQAKNVTSTALKIYATADLSL